MLRIKSVKKIIKSIILQIYYLLPNSSKVRIGYYLTYKKFPNLKFPDTFNEKVSKRIVFEKNPLFSQLADKYLVRNFIEKKIGDNFLIPLIFCSNNPEQLSNLESWKGTVIKPNHAAGMIKIFDEEPCDLEKKNTIKEAKKWLLVDYSKFGGEAHYSDISPCILVEKKITKGNEIPRDYKFHFFRQKDGSFKYVLQIVDGRFGVESRGYYLNSLDNCVWSHGAGKHNLSEHEKQHLYEAIELNKKFFDGESFNYLRIDWYLVGAKLYFGELTFTPGAGHSNEFGSELEKIMSDFWVD